MPRLLRFVARQPIFDARNRIHGYELLYRQGTENQFSGNGDRATRIMLDNTLLFGMNALTGRAKAFVNCTREALLERLVTLLPPKITVLEILESIEPEPAVVRACIDLKEMGYKIALDDFIFRPGMEEMIDLADYIKVDFTASPPEERQKIRAKITNSRTRLLAEKIETSAEFEAALAEGFHYFQGYYFCRPVVVSNTQIPPNRLNYLAVLRALHQQPLDMSELEVLVKREASLCYRLLRLVNSVLYGLRQEVKSIMTALMAIGEDEFRKLASIAIATELNEEQPLELLVLALARARFCELGAPSANEDPTEQYLLGLFSLLPAILRMRMEDIVPLLPFRSEITLALNGEANHARRLLDCLEQYEQGNWTECSERCAQMGLEESLIVENYTQAVQWAEEALFLQ
jgi:c-di-GMP-related signal transduction protein